MPPRLRIEIRIATFGNSHIAARAFPLGRDTDLGAALGRHTDTVVPRYVAGLTQGGLRGDSDGDWSTMIDAAVRLKTDSVWPAYAVIGVGGPALLPKPDGQARRRRLQEGREPSPVPPHRNGPTDVIAITETFVRALQPIIRCK